MPPATDGPGAGGHTQSSDGQELTHPLVSRGRGKSWGQSEALGKAQGLPWGAWFPLEESELELEVGRAPLFSSPWPASHFPSARTVWRCRPQGRRPEVCAYGRTCRASGWARMGLEQAPALPSWPGPLGSDQPDADPASLGWCALRCSPLSEPQPALEGQRASSSTERQTMCPVAGRQTHRPAGEIGPLKPALVAGVGSWAQGPP